MAVGSLAAYNPLVRKRTCLSSPAVALPNSPSGSFPFWPPMFGARARPKEMAQLCRRMAVSLEAGLDIRDVWNSEVKRGWRGATRSRLELIRDEVAVGGSVADGLAQTGSFFPPLFVELVTVGEQTGQLAEIFRQLGENYEHRIQLQRSFLAAITWPMFQLAASICVIGLVIFLLGMIPTPPGGKPMDILGFGLMGTSGVLIYFTIVGTLALAIFAVVFAIRRGVMWTRPLQMVLLKIPVVGKCFETLALARLAWTLHLTMETSLDTRDSLTLGLRSTNNARFSGYCRQVVEDMDAGRGIAESFADTGAFPQDFLDALDVGERSGRLPESMAVLSRQYQEQGQSAMKALTMFAGFAVWAVVAILIVSMIFRIASSYFDTINDLL